MASVSSTAGFSVIRPMDSSYYAGCSNMRLEHYQTLVDRGWRRSGSTYYKPDLTRSCCPHYTIRLEADKFKAGRNQRKALNRWNRYISGIEYKTKAAKLCPRSRDEKRQRKAVFDLCDSVHFSEYGNIARPVDPKTKKSIEPAHKFEINLESDSFSKEKWNVFVAYQTKVHQEPASRWSHATFKRFLCSGLQQKIIKTDGVTRKLGSYHQCYRLDGKLVAVAVLDLLPHGVSSVYLFYDPEYEQWEFGKLSALREIQLTKEGKYNYYYMGYYIPSCIKMRYKGNYKPTSVLDPETLEWNLLDHDLRQNLDKHRYFSLSASIQNPAKLAAANQPLPSRPKKQRPEPKSSEEIDYTSLEIDSDQDEDPEDETSIPEGSLFDLHVPGILSKTEIEAHMDLLDNWKLLLRNMYVDMVDLDGWERGKVTDPQGLKGIVAELAAALGWEVVKGGSAVDLFGLSGD